MMLNLVCLASCKHKNKEQLMTVLKMCEWLEQLNSDMHQTISLALPAHPPV